MFKGHQEEGTRVEFYCPLVRGISFLAFNMYRNFITITNMYYKTKVLKQHCFHVSELFELMPLVPGGQWYNGLSKDSLPTFCVETTNKDESIRDISTDNQSQMRS